MTTFRRKELAVISVCKRWNNIWITWMEKSVLDVSICDLFQAISTQSYFWKSFHGITPPSPYRYARQGHLSGRVILTIIPPSPHFWCVFLFRGNGLLCQVVRVTLSKMVQCVYNRVKVLVPMLVISMGFRFFLTWLDSKFVVKQP